MPQAIPPVDTCFAENIVPRRVRWTREQCRAMRESGVLTGRYELIDGEIFDKMGQGPLHAYVIVRLMTWLVTLFGGDFVRIQLPIQVPEADNDTSEPEPDAAVLSRRAAEFLEQTPGVADVLLLVEVSDTTLVFDSKTKAALYARAGVEDYWVIDLNERRVLVHRQPGPHGYGEVIAYLADEQVASLSRPQATIPVSELLPPL